MNFHIQEFRIKRNYIRKGVLFLSLIFIFISTTSFSVVYFAFADEVKRLKFAWTSVVLFLIVYLILLFSFLYLLTIKYIITENSLIIKNFFKQDRIPFNLIEDFKIVISRRRVFLKDKDFWEIILTFKNKKIRINEYVENFDEFLNQISKHLKDMKKTEKEVTLYYSFIIKLFFILMTIIFSFFMIIWFFFVIRAPEILRKIDAFYLVGYILILIVVPMMFLYYIKTTINSFRTYTIKRDELIIKSPFNRKIIKINQIEELKDTMGHPYAGLEIITCKGKYWVDYLARNCEEFVDILKDKFYELKIKEKS